MGNIRIERVPIQALDLGRLRADHLMLVYQQDPLDYGYYQDRWWVMEGTLDVNPDGTFTVGVDGADGITTLSQANGGKTAQELLDAIRYPSWRGSHIIASADPFQDWGFMAAVARDIDSALYPYFAFSLASSPMPSANSSSVIASLLYYIGVDIAQNMPGTFLTFTTGTRTLFGTSGDDQLQIEYAFNTILAGEGRDTIAGGDDPDTFKKLYGGRDDDVFVWSEGSHIYHGGQPGLDYAEDGIDTVEYTGIGTVRIDAVQGAVPHLGDDFVATHASGTDQLFSIEKIRWNTTSDTVLVGDGVDLIENRLLFDLDTETPGGKGDTLDFTGQRSGLLVAPSDRPDIVLVGTGLEDGDGFSDRGGIWARSLEWIVGSDGNDRIYAGATLLGVEGGAGDDVLSGRLATPLTGASPEGFDIELAGGAGNDVLVSGTGRSLATGGEGDDVFVLSALSEPGRIVEFVIADAGTSDRLFVPYNFLKPGTGEFEGSELFAVQGGVSPNPGMADFSDLPQHAGPGPTGLDPLGGYFYLIWQTQLDQIFVPDASDGIVDIAGNIFFDRDGGDLLIHVFAGGAFDQTYYDFEGNPYQYTSVAIFPDSESVIRVLDFEDGMLGITFFDLGETTPFDYENFAGPGSTDLYENWDAAAEALTSNGVLTAPLQAEPGTPVFDLPDDGQTDQRERRDGTEGDDIIIAGLGDPGSFAAFDTPPAPVYSSGADLFGGAGNDTLVGGAGRDTLDGGTGADAMSGGTGNDVYVVDHAGDLVIELANEGVDRVAASVDYGLTGHVEHLTLTGSAIRGEGNALANRITGTSRDNILIGGAGADTLTGGGGDDRLVGGEGGDIYVYMIGDGVDTIVETGAAGDTDVVRLIGIAVAGVSAFISGEDAGDAVLRFDDGGRIVLDAFFAGPTIEEVRFDDGTVWDGAFLVAAATAGGVLVNDAPVARPDEGFFTHLGEVVIPGADLLANDSDFDGDGLRIVAASTTTPGAVAGVTDGGDIRISVAPGQTGAVAFTYLVSDDNGNTTTGSGDITFIANTAPALTGAALANASILAGSAWTFTIPIDTFSDADGHSMVYTADRADGGALPAWLAYDPDTRVFQGTPPLDFGGSLAIRVTASDSVAATSTTFLLSVAAASATTIVGTAGRDTLTGTSGNDVFDGLGGNDVLDGGAGDDVFLATGNAGFDTYIGGDGTDTIRGSAGDDVIGIAGGPDALSGIESIDGGGGFDILRLAGNTKVLDLSGITVTGIALIDAGAGNDRIIGSAGDDVISGGRGRDTLFGGDGNDTFAFAGNSGRDFYDGGAGFDVISGSSGSDVLKLANGSLDLVSIEAIHLGDGFDVLELGPGDDWLDLSGLAVSGVEVIDGGAGNDYIVASAADETIFGGAGRDVFVFRDGFGHDIIADFKPGKGAQWPGDAIDLTDLGFAGFADLVAHAARFGRDTIITDPGGGGTLRIADVRLSHLQADDFIL